MFTKLSPFLHTVSFVEISTDERSFMLEINSNFLYWEIFLFNTLLNRSVNFI